MRHHIFITILCLVGLLAASCKDDHDFSAPQSRPEGKSFIMFGCDNALQGDGGWKNGRLQSRGTRAGEGEPEENFIESDPISDIGVFAFGDGPNTTYIFKNQRAFYKLEENVWNGTQWTQEQYKLDENKEPIREGNDNKEDNLWPYDTGVEDKPQRPWEPMNYKFFAYSPYSPDSHVSVKAETYDGFNTFIWDNIPGFSDKDHVVANKIVTVDNTGKDPSIPIRTTPDAVHFEMRHILSRIRFFFKLDEHYRKIRRIRLNSITVESAGNIKSATFNFKDNAWDETVHWSDEVAGDAEPVTLTYDDPAGYDILPYKFPHEVTDETSDEQVVKPFGNVYVYPQSGFKEIKLKCNYTVYDSEDVKTRTAEITNTVEIGGGGWTLVSGYYYDIKITIAPAYLYVLSDNDQDFDGALIISDSTSP